MAAGDGAPALEAPRRREIAPGLLLHEPVGDGPLTQVVEVKTPLQADPVDKGLVQLG